MSSPIGFGTWPIGGRAYGPVEDSVAIGALRQAIEQGIHLFDTADIYGDGRAEELLGRTVSVIPETIIVSKAGYIAEAESKQDFSESHLRRALEDSLGRLRRNQIDIFLLHSPPIEILLESNACKVLDQLRQEGLITKVGVSLRTLDTFEAALMWPGCQVVEVILNLLDQRPIDIGLLQRAYERGIEVIARVPLCFGFLSGRHKKGAIFPPSDQRGRWSREQIDSWIEGAERFRFLERPGRSLTQAALAFCVGLPGVTWAIPGMKTPEQVRHNALAGRPECALTISEMDAARQIWRSLQHLPPR